MTKVSYEEAKKAFREICSGYEEPNSKEIVGNFINQHRPPSFDEVVKAWEDLGYRITANKSSAHVMKGYEDVYTIDKSGLFSETKRISYEKLNAINLTIRYLEREK